MALDSVPLQESLLVIVGNHVERDTTLCQHTLDLVEEVIDQLLSARERVGPARICLRTVPVIGNYKPSFRTFTRAFGRKGVCVIEIPPAIGGVQRG